MEAEAELIRTGAQAESIISVEDLHVTYSDGTKAVQGISFDVREGEFFGFLGQRRR